ncbi:hypothetical protein BDY17DRAFT_324605 [Neohortaea acidophila]|uniref:BSD domain-containing protein n=1 Tax=Neohortaea acidophila TaxID=245834 RepID=A0A6A6PRN3_9PEZI|nr:uncharacterized protein BDY17DRAFT_324605 [Neohortaea acidophila]KAF2482314.1 hypothetical protein BDY17DRAFT_324605 [Neohortaea acidophila]
MDIAYDHVQEAAYSPTGEGRNDPHDEQSPEHPDLNTELRTAFQTLSTSQWGTKLGGWFSTARKQGESFYQDLQKEASEAQEQATKGFSSLKEGIVKSTGSLSFGSEPALQSTVPGEEAVPRSTTATSTGAATAEAEALQDPEQRAESLPADIVKEAGSLVASLRSTAASRLKDLQRAEDAADEALLKFGTNVRNFLRDAVVISAPEDDEAAEREVIFETKEPGTGKKVFHSTRLDAQLHAIHTTFTSFTRNPAEGEKWEEWEREFDIESKTGDVAADLERYEELRRAMEKLVPEEVDYKTFWMRYYFLRKAMEEEERRRREVLKGAATNHEAVTWDEDSEDESEQTSTPNTAAPASNAAASASTTTLSAPPVNAEQKTASPRRSHEDESKSVADSDASYDMVSGATSRAMGSPKEEKRDAGGKEEESDDDWE